MADDSPHFRYPPPTAVEALDQTLSPLLASLGSHAGVQVFDVGTTEAYEFNGDRAFTAASSIKVPIMLAFLARLEAQGLEPTAEENRLLAAMIQESDNEAASRLYATIGADRGLASYLADAGVAGVHPEGFARGWGWSTITPRAMVALLSGLYSGGLLTPADRAYALGLMEDVVPWQRYGVGDTAPMGATVAMKLGWVTGPDGLVAMNSSGIVISPQRTYIIAVLVDGQPSLDAGISVVRQLSALVAETLL